MPTGRDLQHVRFPAGDLRQDYESLEPYWLDFRRRAPGASGHRGGDAYRGDSEWALNLPRIRGSQSERDFSVSPLRPVPDIRSRTPLLDPTEEWWWLRLRRDLGAGY